MLHWQAGRSGAPQSLDWLDASESARLALLSGAGRRQQFLNARWALRELLSKVCGGAPQALSISLDASGRSAWAQRPELHLGLSHSGDCWAVAVANAALGIDIEVPNPARERRELARMLLGDAVPADRQAMEAALLQEWCLREAWLKCHGLPLSALPGLRFRAAGPGAVAAVRQVAAEGWTLALVSTALPPQGPGWSYWLPA